MPEVPRETGRWCSTWNRKQPLGAGPGSLAHDKFGVEFRRWFGTGVQLREQAAGQGRTCLACGHPNRGQRRAYLPRELGIAVPYDR